MTSCMLHQDVWCHMTSCTNGVWNVGIHRKLLSVSHEYKILWCVCVCVCATHTVHRLKFSPLNFQFPTYLTKETNFGKVETTFCHNLNTIVPLFSTLVTLLLWCSFNGPVNPTVIYSKENCSVHVFMLTLLCTHTAILFCAMGVVCLHWSIAVMWYVCQCVGDTSAQMTCWNLMNMCLHMYIECTTLQPTYAHVYSPCLWDAYILTPTACVSTGMQCPHTSIQCSNSPRTSVPIPVIRTGMAGRVGVLVYPLPPLLPPCYPIVK